VLLSLCSCLEQHFALVRFDVTIARHSPPAKYGPRCPAIRR
jgi:hypothetical protein